MIVTPFDPAQDLVHVGLVVLVAANRHC